MISPRNKKYFVLSLCLCAAMWGISACAELKKPKTEPFYGNVAPPASSEFRWANGELPKTIDPIFAKSPSEMQTVRAAFDGLTEWDAKTLQTVSAIAADWKPSEDFRTWTFTLRPNAVWSNGKKVTAQDFVRSWKRLAESRENSPHSELIANVIGARLISVPKPQSPEKSDKQNEESKVRSSKSEVQSPKSKVEATDNERRTTDEKTTDEKTTDEIQNPKPEVRNDEIWFGAEAVNDSILRISLIEPDKDFPALAAHSALRPVFEAGEFDKSENWSKIATNGAFRIIAADKNGVLFERSKNYWNAANVKVERVRFVPAATDEAALAAYQAGEVDAVTNTHLEPLALKLLETYQDFKRTTFNAVTFYEFTNSREEFKDRRVREALAIAIDRERLTRDELDGASVAANKFLPGSPNENFKFDLTRAKNLFAEAGFPDGKNFPSVRLLISRNAAQKRVARAIAAQWLKNLNVKTEIVESTSGELGNSELTKDFDFVRRTVVLPTTNEASNMLAMFEKKPETAKTEIQSANPETTPSPGNSPTGLQLPTPVPFDDIGEAPPIIKPTPDDNQSGVETPAPENEMPAPIVSEAQALEMIPAIPLYFPLSYALVKPYVTGFDPNALDAPALKNVQIQTDWQR